MKIKKSCPYCGSVNLGHHIIDEGSYISGKELGRPSGAKGIDIPYTTVNKCLDCDRVDFEPFNTIEYEWFDNFDFSTFEKAKKVEVKINGQQAEVFDKYGNYLFMLPKTQPEDLNAWFKQTFNNFMEYEN